MTNPINLNKRKIIIINDSVRTTTESLKNVIRKQSQNQKSHNKTIKNQYSFI